MLAAGRARPADRPRGRRPRSPVARAPRGGGAMKGARAGARDPAPVPQPFGRGPRNAAPEQRRGGAPPDQRGAAPAGVGAEAATPSRGAGREPREDRRRRADLAPGPSPRDRALPYT